MSEIPKKANHAIELLAGLVNQLHYFYGDHRKFKTDVLKDAVEIEDILKELSINKKQTFKRIAKKYEKYYKKKALLEVDESKLTKSVKDKYKDIDND